jgi:hypothetical protein
MNICDKCKALDVRKLLIDAINNEDRDAATSPDVTFHLSISSLRDSARNGCEVCFLVWSEFVDRVKEDQKVQGMMPGVDFENSVEENVVSGEHIGPVLVSVLATDMIKAHLSFKVPGGLYYDQTSISMELFYEVGRYFYKFTCQSAQCSQHDRFQLSG